jgi:predicted acetyltransferase
MTIELIAAANEDIPALRRLMQFYLYDIASLDQWDIGPDGLYGNPQRIESFWDDGRYDKFLIKVDGILAGFAFTSSAADESNESAHVIQEFFVLRRYRRAGVGRIVATRLFENSCGTWKVSVMASNAPAQGFWARIIGDFTGKEPCEFTVSPSPEDQVLFRFSAAMSQTIL